MQQNKFLQGPWHRINDYYSINNFAVVQRFDGFIAKPRRTEGKYRYSLYYASKRIEEFNIESFMQRNIDSNFQMTNKLFNTIRNLASKKKKIKEKGYDRICAWCGVEFKSSYPQTKYCSRECSKKYNNNKDKVQEKVIKQEYLEVIPLEQREPVVHDLYEGKFKGLPPDAPPGLVQPANF